LGFLCSSLVRAERKSKASIVLSLFLGPWRMIYLVGLVVVVMAVMNLFGLRFS
jgi:hypothetical protein